MFHRVNMLNALILCQISIVSSDAVNAAVLVSVIVYELTNDVKSRTSLNFVFFRDFRAAKRILDFLLRLLN